MFRLSKEEKSHSLQLGLEARGGECGKWLQIDNKIKTGPELRKSIGVL